MRARVGERSLPVDDADARGAGHRVGLEHRTRVEELACERVLRRQMRLDAAALVFASEPPHQAQHGLDAACLAHEALGELDLLAHAEAHARFDRARAFADERVRVGDRALPFDRRGMAAFRALDAGVRAPLELGQLREIALGEAAPARRVAFGRQDLERNAHDARVERGLEAERAEELARSHDRRAAQAPIAQRAQSGLQQEASDTASLRAGDDAERTDDRERDRRAVQLELAAQEERVPERASAVGRQQRETFVERWMSARESAREPRLALSALVGRVEDLRDACVASRRDDLELHGGARRSAQYTPPPMFAEGMKRATDGSPEGTRARVGVLIPALDEERALPLVIGELPRELVDVIVVVDNGSRDRTGEVARAAGAFVVREERRGYGRACLTGLDVLLGRATSGFDAPEGAAALRPLGPSDVVVFLDGDHSDFPEDLREVAGPVLAGSADFVVGSRVLGARASGRNVLPPHSRFGNALACVLMRILFGARHTDLGPFRAIRVDALEHLAMRDEDYGWTVEMQLKARVARLRVVEVPVRYRERIGVSKVTGTLRGSVGAGIKILRWILGWRAALARPSRRIPRFPRSGSNAR